MPNKNQLLLLILLGNIYLIGQLLLTKAFLILPASLVSLYKYNQIIFGVFFGVVFFREIPDFYSIVGASLIIFSGFLNYRVSFIKKQ
jgi:drug/metabolite transporter (DMT)-like permease